MPNQKEIIKQFVEEYQELIYKLESRKTRKEDIHLIVDILEIFYNDFLNKIND
jgi:hypothetical protein